MKPRILSAGIAPVRWIDQAPHLLLLRCYRYWDFPKGECGPGESPLDCALREVAEETGLTDIRLRWGHEYIETPPYGRGKVARYYLAEAPRGDARLPVSPELGHPEHQELRWARIAEAERLLNDRLRAVLHWVQNRLGPEPDPSSEGDPPG